MKLKLYHRKRNFRETPEPSGRIGGRKGPLTFVVQKHAATRTHFDFRLEIDGTLKSWAVPRGISLNPSEQRLAVHVEDHPMEYGGFEGVIPKGNYGAGTVMLWDKGTYVERTSKGRADSERALKRGLEEGKLTFVLEGKKLKGEFALIKLKGSDPKAWLLVKKRDKHVRYGEDLAEEVSVLSGRTMRKIAEESVRKKAIWIPRQGKATSLPKKIRPMQAKISVSFSPSDEWIYEPFLKGERAILEKQGEEIHLSSSGLLSLEKKYPEVRKSARAIKHDLILDGEMVGHHYVAYDLLAIDGKDLRGEALLNRKKELERLRIFDKRLVLGEYSEEMDKISAERVIAKRKESPYHSGISRDWLRVLKSASPPEDDKPRLANLDKVFWPGEDITKGDLLRYYDKIAPFILPYLKDRPESLHRQPDGLLDEGFFQKDNPGYLPKRIETLRISSASSGKTINYILCQDRWTLLYLVNLGCIELNPWLSRKGSLDKPDFVVIDLDPDENPFEEVIEAALVVQDILKSVKIRSWVKTSGASGLHICVPTGGKATYDETKAFAEAVCTLAHRRLKGFTSIDRNPAKRRGKIYLDFLQNRRSQTLAAVYCVRPKPGATVSTPLHWKEVKKGLHPSLFTIETMEKRLKKVGDLWKPMLTEAEDIQAALKKLSRLLRPTEKS